MVPDWLRVEVVTGLQKLLVLRLPGTPPEDAVVGTAEVWLEAIGGAAIGWAQDVDTARVRRAFQSLFRLCEQWPAPKLFLANLGSRNLPTALPTPRLSAAQKAHNLARLKELLATLAASKSPPAPLYQEGSNPTTHTTGENHEHY